MITRLSAVATDRMHLWLMLLLTFGTGVVDAVGYLGLDRVFAGNMTGNVVILGMGVVGAEDLPVLGPLLALAGFMGGAAIGGRALTRVDRAWSGTTTVLLSVVAVVLLVLAVTLLVAGEDPSEPLGVTVTTLLGAAMGLQASTARFVAVKDVTTVVVTSTITGLAADSVLGSGRGGGTGRRLAAVVLLIAGAVAGAGLLRWHLGAGLLLAFVVVLVATTVGGLHSRGVAASSTASSTASRTPGR